MNESKPNSGWNDAKPSFTVDEAMAKWEQLREMYDMPEWPLTAMDVLIAEVERLRAEVQRLDIAGTHTCHDDCPKLPCVQRREIERLRAELAAVKAASVLPVRVKDCYSFGQDVEIECYCDADADCLSGWLRERMKGGEG